MIILTTTYNCENYIEKCLKSIMSQTHDKFICYITDDLSTDNTVNVVKQLISHDPRFILIENEEKMYQCGNYDQVIRFKNINDDEVCVEVDGDDWLYDETILRYIDEVYSSQDVWLTCGTFQFQDGKPSGQKPPTSFNLRNTHFNLSHLRTWKSFLWKKIQIEDLKDSEGRYLDVASDVAFMLPMYEMSYNGHFRFVDKPCYVYNDINPLNDYKVNNSRMWEVDNFIKSKPPYNPL